MRRGAGIAWGPVGTVGRRAGSGRGAIRWLAVLALAVAVGGCRREPRPATTPVAVHHPGTTDEPTGSPGEPRPETPEEHGHAIATDEEPGARSDDTPPAPSAGAAGPASAAAAPEDDRLVGASFRAPVETASPSTATVNAVLAPGACWKELQKRGLPFARSKRAAAGVATPVQSIGPLNGVRIVIPRAPSPYGVLDCRLALTLDEMTKVLAAEGVVEIQIDNTHRPQAKLPRRGAGKSQHAYGLAADITRMKLADGTQLRVDRHWGAAIGQEPCGPAAPMDPVTPESIALRGLVCELARRGVFHHLLTPSFDRAHRDHLHLDIKRGEKRTRIR